jgi:hypothetical protein
MLQAHRAWSGCARPIFSLLSAPLGTVLPEGWVVLNPNWRISSPDHTYPFELGLGVFVPQFEFIAPFSASNSAVRRRSATSHIRSGVRSDQITASLRAKKASA